MSADTGAREPQELAEIVKRHMTTVCLCEWDDSGAGELVAESPECSIHGEGERPLEALEELAVLAAGVGVPPDEARWLWFCSECGACEGDTMQPGCCRSCGSSAEGVRLKARFASDALAGEGEARPTEHEHIWHTSFDIRTCSGCGATEAVGKARPQRSVEMPPDEGVRTLTDDEIADELAEIRGSRDADYLALLRSERDRRALASEARPAEPGEHEWRVAAVGYQERALAAEAECGRLQELVMGEGLAFAWRSLAFTERAKRKEAEQRLQERSDEWQRIAGEWKQEAERQVALAEDYADQAGRLQEQLDAAERDRDYYELCYENTLAANLKLVAERDGLREALERAEKISQAHADANTRLVQEYEARIEALEKAANVEVVAVLGSLWDKLHPEPRMGGSSFVRDTRLDPELVGKVQAALRGTGEV